MLSLHEYAIYMAGAVLALFLAKPFITYILDPLDLRRFPSPSPLASISTLWLMRETYFFRRSRALHEAHKKMGDVIRVAPNQLVFRDPRAVADIYGHLAARKIVKDEFYDRMAGLARNLVTSRDHEEHGRKRRYMSNVFALRTVVGMEPTVRHTFSQLIQILDNFCEQGPQSLPNAAEHAAGQTDTSRSYPIDMRVWFNFFTLDVIGDMAFGLPLGFLQRGTDDCDATNRKSENYRIKSFVPMLHGGIRYSLTLAQMLSTKNNQLVKSIVRSSRLLQELTGAAKAADYENMCRSQLTKRLKNNAPARDYRDFMDRALVDNEGVERKLPFNELLAEAQNQMNAGSETTAAALCSTLFFLASNPETYKKLREEIDERFPPSELASIVPYDVVSDAPYLQACIDEALRLRPPIGYALQRLIVDPAGAEVAGHHLKQGTVVAVSPVSIQRHPDLYPEPDRFNPERWLDKENPRQIHDLKAYNLVFSQGPRACLGRHIAMVELHILISSLIRRYDFSLEESAQQLQTLDLFNANPGPLPLLVQRRRS
ncbi:hypothetical protein CLAIMM_14930 [Cladophialophora immunda]|nr:hypothetical protein CLAIMM_14930 [Cladophialophora immunda]